MRSGEREEDFRLADRRYAELMRQHGAGLVGDEELDAALRHMMVQDAEGRWWGKSRETGMWHYHDGSSWVLGTPPHHQPPTPGNTTNQQSSYGAEDGYRPGPVGQPYGASEGLSGNTSGMGAAATVPSEIKRWNWGAFLLTWIWAFGNRAWGIGALCIVGFGTLDRLSDDAPSLALGGTVGIITVMGMKGSEWAWRRKRWRDVEHFRSVQRKWAWAGLIMVVVGLVLVSLIVVAVLLAPTETP